MTSRMALLLQASLEAREGFHVGDRVSWNSEAGRVQGTIKKVHARDFDVNGYTHHASKDAPQYEIASSKTDHVAYHKAGSLTKLTASSEAMKKGKHAFKTLEKGTHVSWHYRSAIGHGSIQGVHKLGKDHASTLYSIHQTDNHVSSTGKHEPKIVYHYGSALTTTKS